MRNISRRIVIVLLWDIRVVKRGRYLAVRVEGGQCSIQHAAPHLRVSVVQSVRHEEQEERCHLTLIQVLRQFVKSQSNATPADRKRITHIISF